MRIGFFNAKMQRFAKNRKVKNQLWPIDTNRYRQLNRLEFRSFFFADLCIFALKRKVLKDRIILRVSVIPFNVTCGCGYAALVLFYLMGKRKRPPYEPPMPSRYRPDTYYRLECRSSSLSKAGEEFWG